MKYLLGILVIISLSALSFGQEKKSRKERKYSELADSYFDDKEYYEALPYYQMLDSIAPNNKDYLYKLGVCYLYSEYRTLSLPFLQKADRLGVNYNAKPYYLGQAQHLNHEFDNAIQNFEIYLKQPVQDSARSANAKVFIEQCITGKRYQADSLSIKIEHLGKNVNTIYPEYVPLISSNDSLLIFTSRRKGSTGGKLDINYQYFEDIYFSLKEEDGTWGVPENIGGHINTNKHDACAGLSPDGTKLVVYKARYVEEGLAGDLYLSEYSSDGEWSKPKKFGKNINSEHWEPSACFSPDNKTLYFVSNRPGGKGGTDIYMSKLQSDGKWGKAINLEAINTEFDEDAPYLHADTRTLFFSSKGHDVIGGYDIFSSVYDETINGWSAPRNLGYPINTADDDIYFVWSADGTKGYYSSYRQDTYGEKDLYMLTRPVPADEVLIRLTLVDSLSRQKISKATISLLEEGTQKIVERRDVSESILVRGMKHGYSYRYVVEADGYLLKEGSFDVPVKSDYYEIHYTLELKPIFKTQLVTQNTPTTGNLGEESSTVTIVDTTTITSNLPEDTTQVAMNDPSPQPTYQDVDTEEVFKVGSKIIFRNILFEFDRSRLNDSSIVELDKFYELMKKHPSLVVEVSGHTDSIGRRWYNKYLSKRRAKVVVKYLVKKGVSKKRFVAKGYGEKRPFASNSTSMGRQLNRRTEVKVVKFIDVQGTEEELVDLSDIEEWNEDENEATNNSHTHHVVSEETQQEFVTHQEKQGEFLPIKVHFLFNVYDQLTDYSKSRLDILVQKMKENPTLKLKVHAHTDTRGDIAYNQQLSQKRAKTVIAYMVENGIDESRFELASHGEARPLVDTASEKKKHLYNRRVEFEVIEE
ncbi:MAG: OmpA family protein [Cytophagales bacterium]|nr:OmpA family protein [Cytophagales bacterium]